MTAADRRGVGARTLRHAVTFARVDVRRTVRNVVDRKTQVLAYLLSVGLFTVVFGYGAYLFALEAGFGADSPLGRDVMPPARGAVALLWLGLGTMIAMRTVGTRGSLDNDVGVLSVVPTREAAGGLLLSESVLALAWTLPFGLALATGYVAGGGSVAVLATVPLGVFGVTVAAVFVGLPVGLVVRHVVTRIPFVARYKGALAVLVFIAYFALLVTDALGGLVAAIYEPMQSAPTGWFADVLFLGEPAVAADVARAVVALAAVPVVAAAGGVVATRAADRHWFADPVLTGDEDDAPVDPETGRHEDGLDRRFEDALGGVVGRGTAAVTVLAFKRAARSPLKLLYVVYPLFGAVGFVGDVVQSGEVPAFGPVLALVFVAWAGAVAFTLNPLGDQGSALSATVLSRIDGRQFVGAHVLAGVLVAVPAGTALTAGLAAFAPLDAGSVVAVVAGTPVEVVVAALFAVGVGMAFPRYEAVNVTRSTKAVVPSLVAFFVFSVYLLVVVATAGIVYEPATEPFLAGLLSWLLPFGLSVTADTVGTAALAALLPLALAPFASVTYAIRRFENVTVD